MTFDARAFTTEAARLQRVANESERARKRAAGTLARRLPVEARRDIVQEFNLPAARVREGLTTTRGTGFVELRAAKRGIGLVNFGGKWAGRRGPGASWQRRKGGGRDSSNDAFIVTLPSGARQIVRRTSRAALPLRVMYGPSIADAVKNDDRRQRLAYFAKRTLDDEMHRLLGVRT